jgi:hypothetical protein
VPPKIKNCPQELKTRGVSNFWMLAEDVAVGDEVILWQMRQPGTTAPDVMLWRGDVTHVIGEMAKVQLTHVRGGGGGGKTPVIVGDLVIVDVTVTSASTGAPSPPVRIEVVADGP